MLTDPVRASRGQVRWSSRPAEQPRPVLESRPIRPGVHCFEPSAHVELIKTDLLTKTLLEGVLRDVKTKRYRLFVRLGYFESHGAIDRNNARVKKKTR